MFSVLNDFRNMNQRSQPWARSLPQPGTRAGCSCRHRNTRRSWTRWTGRRSPSTEKRWPLTSDNNFMNANMTSSAGGGSWAQLPGEEEGTRGERGQQESGRHGGDPGLHLERGPEERRGGAGRGRRAPVWAGPGVRAQLQGSPPARGEWRGRGLRAEDRAASSPQPAQAQTQPPRDQHRQAALAPGVSELTSDLMDVRCADGETVGGSVIRSGSSKGLICAKTW